MNSASRFPRVPEIITIICGYLASSKSTLASLARTSKIFEESAVDLIWQDLDDLSHLVKCLPLELSEEDETGSIPFSQPLISTDCSRFIHYAKRVKHLTFSLKETIDINFYHALHLALRGEKLFPNIRRLTWQCSEETIPVVHMFLGPLLKRVEFNLSPNMSYLELSLFSALPEYSPQLEDVSLTHIPPPESLSDHQMHTLGLLMNSLVLHKWETLISLEIPFLGYSGIQKISQLPLLENLKVQRCKMDTSNPTKFPKGGFPMLNTLQVLGCGRHRDFIITLKFVDQSPLTSVNINFETVLSKTQWEEIISTLSQQCRKYTLQLLHIEDEHDGVDRAIVMRPRQEMVQFEALKPLLTFPNLSVVVIGSYKGVYFSYPVCIKKMALSWPLLTNFSIIEYTYTRLGGTEPSPITIVDLLHFATNCPHLKTLWIGTFDATSPPVINRKNVYWDRTHTSPLQCLPVSDSPIKEPGQVAAFLSGIFPRLTQITTVEEGESNDGDGPPTGDNHNAWKEVEKLVKMFAAVRDQERSMPV